MSDKMVSKTRRREPNGRVIEDSRMISYLNPAKELGLITVPIERGLSFNAFTLGPGSFHPWYLAAQALVRNEHDRAVLILEKYYELVRPASVVEWHDSASGNCPVLVGLPRHA
jgi:hypothetical protein